MIPPVLNHEELADAIDEHHDLRLLDVRTPGEFENGHIPAAYNVPLDTLDEHAEELGEVKAPVVLICRSGQRAQRAEAALRTSGMQFLHVLEGGMLAWEAAGRPVRRRRERWSLERQVRLVAGLLVFAGTLGAWLVSPWFMAVPGMIGGGLAVAALTDTCAMGLALAQLPYNRASCDVAGMVSALKRGIPESP